MSIHLENLNEVDLTGQGYAAVRKVTGQLPGL